MLTRDCGKTGMIGTIKRASIFSVNSLGSVDSVFSKSSPDENLAGKTKSYGFATSLAVWVFICGVILFHFCSIDAMSQDPAPAAQPSDWRITEKEVAAVQVGLIRRGYLKGRANGTFDRRTREAVRRYQTDNGLKVTGRIDYATYNHLALVYPATGREADVLAKELGTTSVGEGIRYAAVSAGRAVGSAGKTIGRGTRAGMQRTTEMGGYVASKSKQAAQGLGTMTVRGARGAGRS